MSKIVILVFVVLVALVVNASGSMDRLQSVQARVESYFATEIDKFEEKYNTTSLAMTENSRKLLEDAESINRNVSEHKRAIWNKAKEDTLELIVKTLSSGGTEDCYKMFTDIDFRGRVFLSNVYTCTERILNTAFENVAEMKVMYESLHETLIDWRVRIGACARYFNTPEQLESAVSCTETIETQARPLFVDSVPPVIAKIDETNNLLPTLRSSFDKCSNGYAAYETKAADLTSRARICYKKKMEDAARNLAIARIMGWEITKAAPTSGWETTKAAPTSGWETTKAAPTSGWETTKAAPTSGWETTKAAPTSGWETTKAAPTSDWETTKAAPISGWETTKAAPTTPPTTDKVGTN